MLQYTALSQTALVLVVLVSRASGLRNPRWARKRSNGSEIRIGKARVQFMLVSRGPVSRVNGHKGPGFAATGSTLHKMWLYTLPSQVTLVSSIVSSDDGYLIKHASLFSVTVLRYSAVSYESS